MGQARYPQARELLITADGGGRNGSRTRLGKAELQTRATELTVPLRVCHFPPGTRKWNKIEHRRFAFSSKKWRGNPLDSLATIVNLIATTTDTGLSMETSIASTIYETGLEVPEENDRPGGAPSVRWPGFAVRLYWRRDTEELNCLNSS